MVGWLVGWDPKYIVWMPRIAQPRHFMLVLVFVFVGSEVNPVVKR